MEAEGKQGSPEAQRDSHSENDPPKAREKPTPAPEGDRLPGGHPKRARKRRQAAVDPEPLRRQLDGAELPAILLEVVLQAEETDGGSHVTGDCPAGP